MRGTEVAGGGSSKGNRDPKPRICLALAPGVPESPQEKSCHRELRLSCKGSKRMRESSRKKQEGEVRVREPGQRPMGSMGS